MTVWYVTHDYWDNDTMVYKPKLLGLRKEVHPNCVKCTNKLTMQNPACPREYNHLDGPKFIAPKNCPKDIDSVTVVHA